MNEPRGGDRLRDVVAPASCDRGAAAIVLTVMLSLVVVAACAVLGITRVAVARGQASTAADLAALSAATRGGCESARAVALMNGAVLRTCEISGPDFVVAVEVDVVLVARHSGSVTAFARAGPPG